MTGSTCPTPAKANTGTGTTSRPPHLLTSHCQTQRAPPLPPVVVDENPSRPPAFETVVNEHPHRHPLSSPAPDPHAVAGEQPSHQQAPPWPPITDEDRLWHPLSTRATVATRCQRASPLRCTDGGRKSCPPTGTSAAVNALRQLPTSASARVNALAQTGRCTHANHFTGVRSEEGVGLSPPRPPAVLAQRDTSPPPSRWSAPGPSASSLRRTLLPRGVGTMRRARGAEGEWRSVKERRLAMGWGEDGVGLV